MEGVVEEGHSPPRMEPGSSSWLLCFRVSDIGEPGLRRAGERGGVVVSAVVGDRNRELTSRDLGLLGL